MEKKPCWLTGSCALRSPSSTVSSMQLRECHASNHTATVLCRSCIDKPTPDNYTCAGKDDNDQSWLCCRVIGRLSLNSRREPWRHACLLVPVLSVLHTDHMWHLHTKVVIKKIACTTSLLCTTPDAPDPCYHFHRASVIRQVLLPLHDQRIGSTVAGRLLPAHVQALQLRTRLRHRLRRGERG